MTKMILAIAFLVVSMFSAFSAGQDCTDQSCLDASGKTQCCIQDATGAKTCQSVTAANIQDVYNRVNAIPVGGPLLASPLQSTVDSLNNGNSLVLNPTTCSAYNTVQLVSIPPGKRASDVA